MHALIILFTVIVSFSQTATAQQTVSQGEWLAQLLRGMGMDDKELPPTTGLSQMIQYATKNSKLKVSSESYDSYSKNVRVDKEAGGVSMSDKPGTVFYTVFVPRPGRYFVRSQTQGGTQFWTVAKNPTVIVSPGGASKQLSGIGGFSMEGGYNRVSISMDSKGRFSFFEVVPPLQSPMQPINGWVPNEPLRYVDKAVTVVRALDMEGRLPDDSGFQESIDPTAYSGSAGKLSKISGDDGKPLIQADKDAEVAYDFRIRDSGVYTIAIQASKLPDKALFNGLLLGAQLTPPKESSSSRTAKLLLYSGWVQSGPYRLLLGLNQGSLLGGVQLGRKLSRGEDYFNLLKALESEAGMALTARPTDLVTREAASENIRRLVRPAFQEQVRVARAEHRTVKAKKALLPSELPPCGTTFGVPLSPVLPVCQ